MNKESKKDKFKRLASKRTNDVLERIRILGNLASKSIYDYDDNDIRQIFSAVDEQLKAVKSKFISTRHRRFKL